MKLRFGGSAAAAPVAERIMPSLFRRVGRLSLPCRIVAVATATVVVLVVWRLSTLLALPRDGMHSSIKRDVTVHYSDGRQKAQASPVVPPIAPVVPVAPVAPHTAPPNTPVVEHVAPSATATLTAPAAKQVQQAAALLSIGAKTTDASLVPLTVSSKETHADTDHDADADETNVDTATVATDTCAEYLSAIPLYLKEPLPSQTIRSSSKSTRGGKASQNVTLSIHATSLVNFTIPTQTRYYSQNASIRILDRNPCMEPFHSDSDHHTGVWYRLILPKPATTTGRGGGGGNRSKRRRRVEINVHTYSTFSTKVSVFKGSCQTSPVADATTTNTTATSPPAAEPDAANRGLLWESMKTNLGLACVPQHGHSARRNGFTVELSTSSNDDDDDPLSSHNHNRNAYEYYMWVWLEEYNYKAAVREMQEQRVSPSLPLVQVSLSYMAPPVNDACADATLVTINQQETSRIISTQGDLSHATGDDIEIDAAIASNKENACSFQIRFGSSPIHDPGVWYTFQGTGDRVVVKAYSVLVHVFQGRCHNSHHSQTPQSPMPQSQPPPMPTANTTLGETPPPPQPPSLQCVASGSNEFRFDTTANATYHLLVQGSWDTRDFSLSIDRIDPLYNGYAMATPIAVGSTIEASMTMVQPVELADECVQYNRQGWEPWAPSGIWYQFQGTGSHLTIDSCRSDSQCTFISIYSYSNTSQNTLQCVAGTKAEFSKRLVFFTETNETYYAFVRIHTSLSGRSDKYVKFSIDVAPVPVNDQCSSALPIVVGTVHVANLSFATPDDHHVPTAKCPISGTPAEPNARGVWYSFQGNGKTLTARALGQDSALSLYHGPSCGSSLLQCVQGRFAYGRFVFDAMVNTTYYALVRGWDFSYGYKQVNLTLKEWDVTPPSVNDNCATATAIAIDSTIVGNFTHATSIEKQKVRSDCTVGNNVITPSRQGVWYTFQGSSGLLTVKAMYYGTKQLDVAIYKGSRCNNSNVQDNALQCVAGSNAGSRQDGTIRGGGGGGNDKLVFRIHSSETYHVLVLASRYYSQSFDLTLSRVVEHSNNACSTATPLFVEWDVSPQMPPYQTLPFCTDHDGHHDLSNRIGGLWFSLPSDTAQNVTAQTFPGVSMTIYAGSCRRSAVVECVTMSYGSAGPKGNGDEFVTIATLADTMYYIHLNTDANIGLKPTFVAKAPTAENDDCPTATLIDVGSTVTVNWTFATTDAAEVADDCFGGTVGKTEQREKYRSQPREVYTVQQVGVWYRFHGTGRPLFLQHSWNDYKTHLSLYTGNCRGSRVSGDASSSSRLRVPSTSLQCLAVAPIPNERKYEFETEVGATYYILFQREIILDQPAPQWRYIARQTVELSLFDSAPSNDVCARAAPVEIGQRAVYGDTTFATTSDQDLPVVASDCTGGRPNAAAAPSSHPGLWYTVQGTGAALTIDTCRLDNSVAIYTGSCQNQNHSHVHNATTFLQCVAGRRRQHACELPRLVFQTQVNTTYHLLVYGPSKDFYLEISHAALPSNNECSGALPLLPMGKSLHKWTQGNVTFATPEIALPLTNCNHATLDSAALFQLPSLWYRFQGTGLNMTLFRGTWPDPNAVMLLYEGACRPNSASASSLPIPSSSAPSLKCVSSSQISTFKVWDTHHADTHIDGLTVSSTNPDVTYFVWIGVWPRHRQYTSTIRVALSDETNAVLPMPPNM